MTKPEIPTASDTKRRIDGASALPAQLGKKLREVLAQAETQPAPQRLEELVAALAAKEHGEG